MQTNYNKNQKNFQLRNEFLIRKIKSEPLNEQERKDLMEELFKLNASLIQQIINSTDLKGTILTKEDLVGVAYSTLHKCVNTFDVNRNISFSTYLVAALKKAFIREVFEKRKNVTLAQNSYEKFRKAKKQASLEERRLEPAVLARLSGLSEKECKALIIAKRIEESISLDDPITNLLSKPNEKLKVESFIADPFSNTEREVEKLLLIEDVRFLLKKLEKKDKKVCELIKLYFGLTNNSDKYSLEEISQIYKLSRERVRQLILKGIRILKDLAIENNIF